MRLSLKHSVCLFLLLCGFLLSFSIDAFAKDQPDARPYKATTVDECIQEKECVWYHFSNRIFPLAAGNAYRQKGQLTKWANPMNVMFSGNMVKAESVKSFLTSALHIGVYADVRILIRKTSNVLIIISNDWEAELSKIMPKLNKIGAGQSVRQFYNVNAPNSDGCMSLFLGNDATGALASSLVFVNPDEADAERCLARQFYSTYGMTLSDDSSHFDLFYEDGVGEINFNELSIFVLFLLYQPEFSIGLNYSQTKTVFDKTFEKNMKLFREKIELFEKNASLFEQHADTLMEDYYGVVKND